MVLSALPSDQECDGLVGHSWRWAVRGCVRLCHGKQLCGVQLLLAQLRGPQMRLSIVGKPAC